MDKNILFKIWFALLEAGLPPKKHEALYKDFGSAQIIFESSDELIKNRKYLSMCEAEEVINAKKRGLPVNDEALWRKNGIRFVCLEDNTYPLRLRNITTPPYAIWFKGALPEENTASVGIIGSRNCSDYGRRAAAYFGTELAKAGINIISGMAVGIDGLSQTAALNAEGKSYGCLGSGPDVVYPAANKELYNTLVKKGGVISQFIPGTPSTASNFPMRNRLISAFSDLVLVIEARERSGTFITVGYALEQGKDVYAVPGRIDDELSAGCNRLIRDGAGIAACADDVIFELQGKAQAHRHGFNDDLTMAERIQKERGKGKRSPSPVKLPEERDPVNLMILKALSEKASDAENLLKKLSAEAPDAGFNIQTLLARLMVLQMDGRVEEHGGLFSLPVKL